MRTLGLSLAAVTVVASLFLAYIGWNALRAPRIDGYQGRYLLVVLALVALVLVPDPATRPARDGSASGLASMRTRVGGRTGWLVVWSALVLLLVEIGLLWHSYV
jgi:hypothetical protein